MNQDAAKDRNIQSLLRLVLALAAAAGVRPGEASSDVMPRYLRSALGWLLLKAESALRRHIFVLAENVEVEAPRERPASPSSSRRKASTRKPSFPLLDPRKRFFRNPKRQSVPEWQMPRCSSFDEPRAPYVPKPVISPTDDVSSVHLKRRLEATLGALRDPEMQALRLAKWRASQRRKAEKQARDAGPGVYVKPIRETVLRIGQPPGFCRRSRHPIDDLLKDLHARALYRVQMRPAKIDSS